MPDPTRLRILYVRSRPLVQYAKPDADGELVTYDPDDQGAVAVQVPPLDTRLEFDKLVEILDLANLPISLHILPHATVEDFALELSKGYDVVYFDGHGTDTTLLFEGPSGESHDVGAAAVAGLFEDSGAKLAVLSACTSSSQLVAICQAGVPAAVGMTGPVPQLVAAAYVRGFFTALTQGKPLAQAHKLGLKTVKAKMSGQPSDEELPTLVPADANLTLVAPDATGKLELTGARPPTNFSLPDKPFIGRGEMIVAINRALTENRIVVLEGEGGIGKTALAQHVALWQAERNKCPGGAAFVPFDPPLSRDLAIDAIGVALFGGDFVKAHGDHFGILKEHFAKHSGLVVLDGFETTSSDSGVLQLVHDLSPVTRVLITTRERVRIGRTIVVKELDDTFAMMLLAVLAHDAGWDGSGEEDTLKAICSELGNMPLAIELVAPQAATLPLHTILERIRETLGAVAADRPDLPRRQRSLIVSLDLSFAPLSAQAKLLFRRLSVFASGARGFMLPDVCDVKDWEMPATELVERRLLRFEDDRYTMLPPVRRYAAGRLAEAGEKDKYEEQFAMYCGAVAQQIHEQMDSAEGAKWTSLAGFERDNLLAAQRWFLEHDEWDEAAGMADLLTEPFDRSGSWAARKELYAPLREHACKKGNEPTLAVILHQLATLAQDKGDFAEARKLYDQALAIEQELGNKPGIAQTLHNLAMLAQAQGEYDKAREFYNHSLAIEQELGNKPGIAKTLHQLAMLTRDQGDHAEARRLYGQALEIFRELGAKYEQAAVLHQLGGLVQDRGDFAEARQLYDQSLAINQELGVKLGIASTLHQLGNLAYEMGDLTEAERLYRASLATKSELGDKAGMGATMHNLALLVQLKGDADAAQSFYEKSLAIAQEIGDKMSVAAAHIQLGKLARLRGDSRAALHYFSAALPIQRELQLVEAAETVGEIERLGSTAETTETGDAGGGTTGDIAAARGRYDAAVSECDARAVAQAAQDLGRLLVENGDWQSGIDYLEHALLASRKTDEEGDRADALFHLARAHHSVGNHEKARTMYRDAIRIYEHAGRRDGVAMCRAGLGRLFIALGLLKDATEQLRMSAVLFEDIGELNKSAEARRTLSAVESMANKGYSKQ